jgi:lipopolysaccharide/colanic/teichoic acid biosynthesis glycosyltransferase
MNNQFQLSLKRLIDVVAAAAGLLLLAPIFVAIAVAIKLDSEGPVFFVQQRVGLRGKLFPMLKFRTMLRGAEEIGSGLYVGIDDSRITRVGRFLRRFSLDELPQLVHVLSGQMGLVGPRPALPYQLQYYSPRSMRRFLLHPGITGWSQVNGRNLISWPERLEMDVWYVENFSLALDLHILLRTPLVWLSGEGLYGARENFFFTGKDDVPMPSRENQ